MTEWCWILAKSPDPRPAAPKPSAPRHSLLRGSSVATDPDFTYRRWTLAAVLAVTALRLLVLRVSPLDLLPDEAQYWSWSREFAFGYFSKPPLIAWLIRISTLLAGDGELGVRLAAPLLHAGTALVLFHLGRAVRDARTGFWIAITYATLPGISFSSTVISTDVPLLFAWSVALLAAWQVTEGRTATRRWTLILGAAIGVGFLAKYAMIYFVLGLALHAALSVEARRFWRSRQALLAVGLAVLIVAPNLIWNAAHGWATFSHTAANAAWGEGAADAVNAPAFLGAQFGIFGPLLLGALLVRLALVRRQPLDTAERFLFLFAAPTLLIVLIQATLARAHPNWAAPTYVAATVWAVRWLLRNGSIRWAGASLGLHLAIMLVFYGYAAGAVTAPLPKALDAPLAFRRGWSTLGKDVRQRVLGRPDLAVVTVDRKTAAALTYYLRDLPNRLLIVPHGTTPGNQYELTSPITAANFSKGLLVLPADDDSISERFGKAETSGRLLLRIGTGRERRYRFVLVEGFRG